MAVNLIIAPEVERDIADAYAWYEKQRPGLGEDFLSCVDALIQAIVRMPNMYTTVFNTYRRGLVRRFPYGIFYEYIDETVIVYGIFHTSIDPDKWQLRLS